MSSADKELQKRVENKIKEDARYEKYKKSRAKRKKRLVKARRIIAIVLGSLIFLFCVFNLNYLTPSKMAEHFKAVFADMGTGEGFPYKFDTRSVLNFSVFNGDDYSVLTEDYLIVLNSSAKPVLKFRHKMAHPVVKYSNDRILLYDQGSSAAYILNQSGTIITFPIETKIVCADISNSGKTVIVTSTSKTNKNVDVYARDGEKVFNWTNGTGYVVDAALNSSGSTLAVGLIDTKDAVNISTVLSFNVSSAKQRGHKEFSSANLIDIDFINSSDIGVLFNNNIMVLDSVCETKNETKLDAKNVKQLFIDPKGNIVNLYSPYKDGVYIIDVYNASLEKKFTKECKGEVKCIFSDGNNIAALFKNRAEWNKIGSDKTYTAELDEEYLLIVSRRKTVYLCGNGIVTKEKVKRQ